MFALAFADSEWVCRRSALRAALVSLTLAAANFSNAQTLADLSMASMVSDATPAIGTQITLHQILIGAVGAHREETSANQAGPERERLRKIKREIEQREFIKLRSAGNRRAQAAVD